MKNTPEVREALVEMATLLANIAQGKLNAVPKTEKLENLVFMSRAMGMSEAAAFLRNVHDALCETNFVPEPKMPSAKVFVN